MILKWIFYGFNFYSPDITPLNNFILMFLNFELKNDGSFFHRPRELHHQQIAIRVRHVRRGFRRVGGSGEMRPTPLLWRGSLFIER